MMSDIYPGREVKELKNEIADLQERLELWDRHFGGMLVTTLQDGERKETTARLLVETEYRKLKEVE
jgi:hypothetical protein